MLDAAGDGVASYFAALKRDEFFAYHSAVSPWEIDQLPDRLLNAARNDKEHNTCAGSSGCTCATPELYPRLGELLTGMLCEMGDRGSDSAGVAVYGDPSWSPPGHGCVSLLDAGDDADEVASAVAQCCRRRDVDGRRRSARRYLLTADVDSEALLAAVSAAYPDALVAGFGAESPCSRVSATRATLTDGWGLAGGAGLAGCRAHPDGHRVGGDPGGATPTPSDRNSAWCTTAPSPTTPPSAVNCVAAGVRFDSENDTEVGARFVAQQLAAGRDMETALKELCATLRRLLHAAGVQPRLVRSGPRRDRLQARGHRRDRRLGGDGSEYRALAGLPGVENAAIWEPEPEVVYAWTRA